MTNTELVDQIPPLKPARAEIPPSFWEQNGGWVIAAVLLLIVVGVVIAWLLKRPKPSIVISPEAEAWQTLQKLSGKPENGETLSKVSRVVRKYFVAAFDLPREELTTSELNRLLQQNEKIGRDLADRASEFLEKFDVQKFAPPQPVPPLSAVSSASKLIELAEERRAYLRKIETAEEDKG